MLAHELKQIFLWVIKYALSNYAINHTRSVELEVGAT